jgi:hypothetical protein
MAFTETAVFAIPVANQMFICYRLVGDASDTTWSAPCGKVDAAWVQGTASGNVDVSISWATNVVTFSEAFAAASTYYVYVIGTA